VSRRFLALDLETTSKIPAEARVTEIGAALWDVARRQVLQTISITVELPVKVEYPDEVQRLTGITAADVEEFGEPLPDALLRVARICVAHGVERLVGHNGRRYDSEVLRLEVARFSVVPPEIRALLALPWIDTLEDIAYPEEMTCRKLPHLAADHGFLNPFPHKALPDAWTALKIMECYDLDEILRRADSPAVVLHSRHAFGDNDKAKSLGFKWKPELGKRWLRATKELDLEGLRQKAAALPELQIQRVNDVTPEQVSA